MGSEGRQLRIRPARTEDAAALARLAESSFRATYSAHNSASDMNLHCARSFGPDLQLREIVDPGLETWLCEHARELVAYAQLRWGGAPACVGSEDTAEIQRFYVSAGWHGRGVAQSLMSELVARAIAKGCDRMWLGVWERNPKAIAFYEKCGFKRVGEQTFHLGDDPQNDWIMMRTFLPKVGW